MENRVPLIQCIVAGKANALSGRLKLCPRSSRIFNTSNTGLCFETSTSYVVRYVVVNEDNVAEKAESVLRFLSLSETLQRGQKAEIFDTWQVFLSHPSPSQPLSLLRIDPVLI